ncbi:DeoR family transcriptional regulator protein (plasmid) [Rhizobium gallicum bv. gallicum R602sp]|uniref:DeoR family transcriptional regulator protein n=1 Tax=Rhizobium gallicum bv. gallicum R602sp TaxID=1041138 RepID=A0A0B4X5Q8_9HYPH|nr:DeoR/GlpR family DNA-binding transcription regulator [Rhizobium gallicum]AJD43434.1 DeoR family transcriptional regulator protein [Rhizobium gallicum bv. gallicum R602sp]
MKRDDRRQAIMDLLVAQRVVDLDDLSDRFAVSKMTIHRDLDDLEQAGMLRKVRGGATIEAGGHFESDFRFRQQQEGEAKRRMAEAALELVEPGMTVMVNDGSMASVLGELLPQRRPLTVITNNAAVIDRLKTESGINLIAVGGRYSMKFNGFFGVVAEQALSRLSADIAFISTPAVSGLRVYHMDDDVVRSKRAMIASAARRCLLLNHKRFNHTALHVLATIDEFEVIITDQEPSVDIRAALEGSNVQLRVASQERK